MPFRCQFCRRYFCSGHRLPENHACPEHMNAMARRKEIYQPVLQGTVVSEKPSYGYVRPRIRIGTHWFSRVEIIHLAIGSLLVLMVGLSLAVPVDRIDLYSPLSVILSVLQNPLIIVSSAMVFTSVFVPHELAHKAVAKYYGLWAEFRLTALGIVLTLLSIISPIKLVSPGAVMISGSADKKVVGRTAVAGPLTNIIIALLFFSSSLIVISSLLSSILLWGATLSSWIALFNLIPFSIIDGAKVFWWNKLVWAACFSTSLALTLVTMLLF